MPAIASAFVEVLPETSKIADGIKEAFRRVDPIANEAGLRWKQEIEKGLQGIKTDVKVGADTAEAEEKIDKATRERKPKIKPEADTEKAEEELDKTARDRKTKIKV